MIKETGSVTSGGLGTKIRNAGSGGGGGGGGGRLAPSRSFDAHETARSLDTDTVGADRGTSARFQSDFTQVSNCGPSHEISKRSYSSKPIDPKKKKERLEASLGVGRRICYS